MRDLSKIVWLLGLAVSCVGGCGSSSDGTGDACSGEVYQCDAFTLRSCEGGQWKPYECGVVCQSIGQDLRGCSLDQGLGHDACLCQPPGGGGTGGSGGDGGSGGTGGVGGSGAGGSGGSPSDIPPIVDIHVIRALVGPGKVDGTQWDGFPGSEKITPAMWEQLSTALAAASPYTAAAAFLAGPTCAFLSKPDPYAQVELAPYGAYDSSLTGWIDTQDTNTEDTFNPHWTACCPTYLDVPFSSDLRLRIHVIDEDLTGGTHDDDIGMAVLNSDDIAAAYKSHQTYDVPVYDQTQKQLLFVGIEVTASH